MDEKIKTWPLRFPTRENPNMEKPLFDWQVMLQYDVKAKYRLISRKFSGIHPLTRMTGFLVVSFRKEIFVFWYLLKCELTSDGCQYLFVLCGP